MEQQRTKLQNKALHKYLGMVAQELSNQGQTIQDVVAKVSLVEILPTTQTVKEVLWRPIQEATLGKSSTTELTTAEINKVYEVMSLFLAKEFEISLPFPNYEETSGYINSFKE